MSTPKRILTGLLVFCVAVLFATCRHELPFPIGSGGGSGPDSTGAGNNNTCSPDSVYFENSILPLINAGCAQQGCHDAVTRREGVQLTDYSHIVRYVKGGNASASTLFRVLTASGESRMPPVPQPAFSASDRALIEKWINQGAKNNKCNAGCDTSNYGYAAVIAPMMKTYCTGCHNAATASGTVDLSSYNQVKIWAGNGRLIGSIRHDAGYSAMPKGGAKLSDCQIAQVENWIAAGSPNN